MGARGAGRGCRRHIYRSYRSDLKALKLNVFQGNWNVDELEGRLAFALLGLIMVVARVEFTTVVTITVAV